MKKENHDKKKPWIRWFNDIGLDDLLSVGGKNSSLGELIRLDRVKVPNGFAITTHAYNEFMKPLKPKIAKMIAKVQTDGYNDVTLLEKTSREIRLFIEDTCFDREFEFKIAEAFKLLDPKRNVAVRSSATAEDLPDASFAGQLDND